VGKTLLSMIYKIKYQQNNKIKTMKLNVDTYDQLQFHQNYPINIIEIKSINSFKFIDFLKQDINLNIKSKDTTKLYELFSSLNMMLKSSLSISQSIDLLLETTK
jgi:type II secretory pathway component PulF